MRFADRLTVVKEGESRYDPNEGRYVVGEPDKATLPCKISAMGTDRTMQVFGEIDRDITIARLQRPYTDSVDYVLINEQKYNVKRQSDYRKGVFFLESAST